MESIWTFPLFVIFPIVGIILVVMGILKLKVGKSKSTLIAGISVLALPFLLLFYLSSKVYFLEKRLVGKYDIGNDSETLIVRSDGTFDLKSTANFLNAGSGTWDVQEIDELYFVLNFKNKSDVWLEIKEEENCIKFTPMQGGSGITNELIKNTNEPKSP